MGYGSCVDGIKAAIDKKEKQCKHQQAIDDYNRNQRKKEASDALGYDPFAFTLHNASVVANSTQGTNSSQSLGPFDSECAAYSDPSCHEKAALCNPSYGCNKQLWLIQNDFDQVKSWYGMYQNVPCYR